ncbi:MAG: mechanosensitive ion channel family protein [Candidatus Hodarchaeota archaeon]
MTLELQNTLSEWISNLGEWIVANIENILLLAIIIIVCYVIYKVISREITSLKTRKKLDEHLAYTLLRVNKWVFLLVLFSVILAQFGLTLGMISGLLTILGGTIIGFAAINTIGNAIAGFIVMTSKPFRVGDRISFKGEFADVEGIELIYTKLRTLDNNLVSVPNQELLKVEIVNFGKKDIIRRHVNVTVGYIDDSNKVEKALLEAAGKISRVLKDPKPYVWITDFQSFAVEYTLYVFIDNIKRMREIDAELYRTVLETCKSHNIDISTPTLIRSLQ